MWFSRWVNIGGHVLPPLRGTYVRTPPYTWLPKMHFGWVRSSVDATRKKARSFFIFAKKNMLCSCILEGAILEITWMKLLPSLHYNATWEQKSCPSKIYLHFRRCTFHEFWIFFWNLCSHCIIMPRVRHKNATWMPHGCHMDATCCLQHAGDSTICLQHAGDATCCLNAATRDLCNYRAYFFWQKCFCFLRAFFREASTGLLTHPKCTLGSQLVGGGTYVRTPPIHLGREMESAWTIEQSERVMKFQTDMCDARLGFKKC